MAYTKADYKTKKALKEALKRGERIEVYQPGPFGPSVSDGSAILEGPHYPEPRRWWASAIIKNGAVVKIS